jgi:DNA-directed RNA polymerase subunit RPC12/RpoP
MGLFKKGYPYYVMNKYFAGRKDGKFAGGVVFRYICPSCSKHFNEKVPELSPRFLQGIPLRRRCTYCGQRLKVENVFEDRRKQ